jgi:foldase protein PrsA
MNLITNGEVLMVRNIQQKIHKKMRKSSWKTAASVLLVLITLICGCDMSFGRKKPEVIEPTEPPVAAVDDNFAPKSDTTDVSEVRPENKKILVKVNGEPLYMQSLYDVLVDDYGLPLAKQFIADELVRQELVRQGISTDVTKEQVKAESRKALQLIFGSFTPDQLDGLLAQFLAKQNYTLRQWNITMRRNVGLSRLATLRAKISDEELRQEFLRRYNGTLSSRHIQVPTLAEAENILSKLKEGQDFAKLAYKYSTNPSGKQGAWLPEIGTQATETKVNPVLVQVVRSLKKPGDYSGAVQVGTNFHIVKLEKTIPPKNVKFDNVRDELRAIVLVERTQKLQQEILQELFQKAKIEYVAPSIREKIEQGKK